MAVGSLLALLDDITTVLDDVSILTKVAAKKTAAVLGDDLALNAEQVSGVDARREWPVVWAVAKGSFINKLILVPAALAISYLMPSLITPILMLGGLFLCFEGFEKIAHKLLPTDATHTHKETLKLAAQNPKVDFLALEKDQVKGAIRTDFILSAEIIAIALGAVSGSTFPMQILVVSMIALGVTVLVYGLVAGIVKLDDVGLYLMLKKGRGTWLHLQHKVGRLLLTFAPHLMRGLTIAGTAAMFLVGGSIIKHGIAPLRHYSDYLTEAAEHIGSSPLTAVTPILLHAVIGVLTGAFSVGFYALAKKVLAKKHKH